MTGRHARVSPKKPRRLAWLWVLVAVLAVSAGAWAFWFFGGVAWVGDVWQSVSVPASVTTAGGITTTTVTTTTTTVNKPVQPVEPTPIVRHFARPEEMRGVWLAPGVEYAQEGQTDEAACRAAIDTALQTVADWGWNTVLVPMSLFPPEEGAFDAPAYILEKAREHSLFVYMILDLGVYSGQVDPLSESERMRLTILAEGAARRVPADGFLLTGYGYAYGHLPEDTGDTLNALLIDMADALHRGRQDAYIGLLSEAVWAHASVVEGGSDTANVYEELTDGGVDTRAVLKSGALDFVMVKNFRVTGDYSAAFSTVLSRWSALCEEADLPLYMAHASTAAAAGERRWAVRDQLARQVLACQKDKRWQGSTFDSLAALEQVPDATAAMKQAFDGTLMEEYISRTLTVTSPATAETVTNSSTVSLRGSADPNFALTLNGEPLALTDHGYFALDKELEPGDNVFVFENKGVKTTYTVHYKVVILKSVSPAEDMLLDGGARITVSAVAHEGATVFATVNGQKIAMEPVEVQEDEGGLADDGEYVTYAGYYTLPAGREGESQSLGVVTVSGNYRGQTATMTGGKLTVKALPITEKPTVEDVALPDLTPIDPATNEKTLAEGTVLIVTADYAETFNGDTTDDYSRPTNAYLPKGTTDVLMGTAYDAASGHWYYRLGCGRRIYQEDAKPYITGGRLSPNTLSVGKTTANSRGTTVTLGADWRVPFQLQLLPQTYGNPNKQDYNIKEQTTAYVEITFSYTTEVKGAVDVSASPLFRKADWIQGENNTYVLRLHLKNTAQFYGYRVMWDDEGNLTFTFKHPTYVGSNDPEQPLAGFTVVIDPGHGGHSYGTSGGNLPEKTLALTYGKLLQEKLESLGATVVMTRTDDTTLSLLQRTQITRASGADLFLSLHMDGSTSTSVGGCSVHYFNEYSRGIAEGMQKEMQAVYTAYGSDHSRRFRWDPFYVCRISEMPALLLECGYMTNAEDLELLVTPDFQDALTAAMVKSVVAYAKSLPAL